MGLLPVFAWLLAFGILQRRFPRSLAFGLSGLAAYSWALLSVEGLSAFGHLHRAGLALSWLLFMAAFGAYRLFQPAALPRYRRHRSVEERWLLGFAALAGSVVLALGLLAAPNNWDSMTYHLPRVMQWAARGSVAFYETGISRQLSQPPGAEYALLHLFLLSGTDRMFAALQGAAGLMAAAAVWRMARTLGATRTGAAWGVFVLAATPMALLQASSTQNDLVLAALLAWTLVFGLQFLSGRRAVFGVTCVMAASLAVATKGTAWVLLPPVVLFLLGLAWRRGMMRRVLTLVPLGVLLLALFAGPPFMRNHRAFGSPLGPDYGLANAVSHPAEVLLGGLANAAKNTAFALRTPIAGLNALLERGVHALHGGLGLDVNDGRFHWLASPGFSVRQSGPGQWLHEDYAPNMAPAWLSVVALASVLGTWLARRPRERLGEESPAFVSMVSYAWLLLAGWALFSLLLRWQIWHGRLLLPLAVLAAPWLGVWICGQRGGIRALVGALLLAGALPVLLLNRSRPLLGPESVLVTPREQQYFANRPDVYAGYRTAAAALHQHGAQHTLLYLSGDSWEYPLWVLGQEAAAQPADQASAPSVPASRGAFRAAPLRSGTRLPHGDIALSPETKEFPTLLLCWKDEQLNQDTLVLAGVRYGRRGPRPPAGAPGVFVRAETVNSDQP